MNKIEVANGYVELISHMSSEADICRIARISTGSDGTNDVQLINHLVKKGHNQVLEFGQMIFKIKCPIFVARQWQRYRTGSFNEASGRYREMTEFYASEKLTQLNIAHMQTAFDYYKMDVEFGANLKQDARQILPLATMTEFYWRTDCNNIMNFLKQRLHKSAQSEIREYADAVTELFDDIYPAICQAFFVYRLNTHSLLGCELIELKALLIKNNLEIPKYLE